ncbi:acyl carrier protein [Actinophytocola sp.]|jgi:acyl carrier protein|uniref:acyl carrier protein n=1 Tax=Actinophytocola sp. TaxID=1872138 RepID=UPI003899BBE5
MTELRAEIQSRIADFLANSCGMDRAAISAATRLEDVDVDSLEFVELIQILQNQFGVRLSDDGVFGVRTVGALTDLVVSRSASEPVRGR